MSRQFDLTTLRTKTARSTLDTVGKHITDCDTFYSLRPLPLCPQAHCQDICADGATHGAAHSNELLRAAKLRQTDPQHQVIGCRILASTAVQCAMHDLDCHVHAMCILSTRLSNQGQVDKTLWRSNLSVLDVEKVGNRLSCARHPAFIGT